MESARKESVAIIVPCFNEERRLQLHAFQRLLADQTVRLIFVDDGSRDGTPELLETFCKTSNDRALCLQLPNNQGKAEAVRQGMLSAYEAGDTYIGFVDADLATPIDETLAMIETARADHSSVFTGCRVGLAGSTIQRGFFRHIFGRLFARAAALALGIRYYDTQCGAKIFKRSLLLRQALSLPFIDRWSFDVELIGRFLYPIGNDTSPLTPRDFKEVPIYNWRQIPGSKLSVPQMVRTVFSLLSVSAVLRRRKKMLQNVKNVVKLGSAERSG